MSLRSRLFTAPLFAHRGVAALAVCGSLALLGGCKSSGELVVDQGVGITALRSTCPAVGMADYTGDITVFRVPGSTDSRDIDVTAAITDVRSVCDKAADPVNAHVTFKVQARRADSHGARDVSLPYFVTVMRGGDVVIAKRVNVAALHFADGQLRAETTGSGEAIIDRREATLDPEVRNRILKQRKAGEADAAVDPLADPEVKQAVAKASFEVLVGFQLTDAQLKYNATR
jgi:hypothetical protein